MMPKVSPRSSTNPISKLLRMLSRSIGPQRIRSTAIRRFYEAWEDQLGKFLSPIRLQQRLFQKPCHSSPWSYLDCSKASISSNGSRYKIDRSLPTPPQLPYAV